VGCFDWLIPFWVDSVSGALDLTWSEWLRSTRTESASGFIGALRSRSNGFEALGFRPAWELAADVQISPETRRHWMFWELLGVSRGGKITCVFCMARRTCWRACRGRGRRGWPESLAGNAIVDSDFRLWMLCLNQHVFEQENMSVRCAEKS
jgi:hypothetical protein